MPFPQDFAVGLGRLEVHQRNVEQEKQQPGPEEEQEGSTAEAALLSDCE